jgi:oleate hydratase
MTATDQRTKPGPSGPARAYLVGGGIASLACAVYLIRDGRVPGERIHIFDESALLGGSLDGQGSAEKGYVIRGGRMFDERAHTCTYDLLSSIPSPTDPGKTLKDGVVEFNRRTPYHSNCRLVENGRKVDTSRFGLSWRDRLTLIRLCLEPETLLGARRIQDCFDPSFFESNFWVMWCTVFSFQPWHSAVEFKRYLLRLIQWFHAMPTLEGVQRMPINQYEYVVLPVTQWLEKRGVHFHNRSQVTDLDFKPAEGETTVQGIHYRADGTQNEIAVGPDDLVFVTLGSMTAGSRLGSMTSAPTQPYRESGGAWALWETIAKKKPAFGRPAAFNGHVPLSSWVSFTLTLRDPTFATLMERFTGNRAGTGGLVTFKDSNWLMSVVLLHQPHFQNQPDHVTVCWGYGLFPDRAGNYVPKRMSESTGAEILTELCSHFRFAEETPRILATSTCIPCMMPYITSQFMPRAEGDRPAVIPEGSTNLAFLGQYCEIPHDTVFTVEYSVRSAQIAVYSLLKLDRKVTPIYKGQYDPRVVLKALMTMLK